jgi:hypothetical protein
LFGNVVAFPIQQKKPEKLSWLGITLILLYRSKLASDKLISPGVTYDPRHSNPNNY